MDPSLLALRHAFGINTDVQDVLQCVDDFNIAYLVGQHVVLHNPHNNVQKFMCHVDKDETVTALALSPNRKNIAAAFRGDPPHVTVYDVLTQKRKKSLIAVDVGEADIVSLAFSAGDGRHLLTQGSGPGFRLAYWNWERAKVLAAVTLAPAGASSVLTATRSSLSPCDPQAVCTSGNGVLKFFRYADGQLKPCGAGKREPQHYTTHAWLPPEDRVVGATDTGELVLFENSDFKCVILAASAEPSSVCFIAATSKGFLCAGNTGVVTVFERHIGKELYHKTQTITIDCSLFRPAGEAGVAIVKAYALTQQEDHLCFVTTWKQILRVALSNGDHSKADVPVSKSAICEPLTHPTSSAAITSLGVCVRKPLAVTCSKDKTVRVWNFLDHSLDVSKAFTAQVTAVALHPLGLHILVSSVDRLWWMNLCGDSIQESRSFPVRSCHEIQFSRGGQYFAAVQGNVVHVYSTYSGESMNHLRGHSGKVRAVCWAADDSRLLSVCSDGAVYDWNLRDDRRESDGARLGGCTAIAVEGKFLWAAGTDKKLRELDLASFAIIHEIDAGTATLCALVAAPGPQLLFGGGEDGAIHVYALPLQGPLWRLAAHSGPASHIALTPDGGTLVSAGDDGALCLFDIADREGRPAKKEVTYSHMTLISKADLEEKVAAIAELQGRLEEARADTDYQQRRQDIRHEEVVRHLTAQFREEMDRQEAKYRQLLAMKEDQDLGFDQERRELIERHRLELERRDAAQREQLQAALSEVSALQRALAAAQKESEAKLASSDGVLDRMRREMEEDFRAALATERELIDVLRAEKADRAQEEEEVRRQLELDTDAEIEELRAKYEGRLQGEREAFLRLKGENGLMRKKILLLQKEGAERQEEAASLRAAHSALEVKIKALERDVEALKLEIRERDETIGDKEKRIYDLKKKNQELEKFKFVLDYKIHELKSQIEPRLEEIAQAQQKLREMGEELERAHRHGQALELRAGDLNLKANAQQREAQQLAARLRDAETYKARLRGEIADLSKVIMDPKALKESVKRLYQRHITEDPGDAQEFDDDLRKEHDRQREYLEKTVTTLKRKVAKDTEAHKTEKSRIILENMKLVTEVNELRREVKALRSAPAAHLPPAPKPPKSDPEPTRAVDAQREIDMQRLEIQRLRNRLEDLERQLFARGRPISSEKLPPMEGFGGPPEAGPRRFTPPSGRESSASVAPSSLALEDLFV